MSLKRNMPRNEYLLVLLLLSSALLMAASTAVAKKEVVEQQQQQQEGAMNEKCLYVSGSITCTGNTTCCSSGQYNSDVPQCIDPSTEQCCLNANASSACALAATNCCAGSCCLGQCCNDPRTDNDFCCSYQAICCNFFNSTSCVPPRDSPCVPYCGPNEPPCPEPLKCCGGYCYDPSTAICCVDDENSFHWFCNSGQTCNGDNQCCDQQSCGGQCYDPDVSQCCTSSINSVCPSTDSCCPSGSGATSMIDCCPPDTSCCASGGFEGSSCCYANQTCCANEAGAPVCCNEGEVCDYDNGDCVPATHSPEKESGRA